MVMKKRFSQGAEDQAAVPLGGAPRRIMPARAVTPKGV
jgi:hypothetical protein